MHIKDKGHFRRKSYVAGGPFMGCSYDMEQILITILHVEKTNTIMHKTHITNAVSRAQISNMLYYITSFMLSFTEGFNVNSTC